MKFRIKRSSRPGWEHYAEAGTIDECLRYLMAVHRQKRFIVDYAPWEGFQRDADGNIARDEHGIGLCAHSGVIEVIIAD